MDFKEFKKEAEKEASLINSLSDLEKWRVKYLGRKSALSLFFHSLSQSSLQGKKRQGQEANKLREALSDLYNRKKDEIEKKLSIADKNFNFLDITQPGKKQVSGHLHPLTLVTREIVAAFEKMGFSIVEGSEIETEYYNFDALNMPSDHPAREMWDTLWLRSSHKVSIAPPAPRSPTLHSYGDGALWRAGNCQLPNSKLLLRTHTSPMQIRYMEKHQPPFRIIVPGRCFRYEATDASHEVQFHQIEGLMVGENITLSNFKAVIEEVIKDIFKQRVLVRFRPSYFPFVSPGVEVDIKIEPKACPERSRGIKSRAVAIDMERRRCSVAIAMEHRRQKSKVKDEWLEIMGAGMVHPALFKRVGYENNRWQGFAFGLGIERFAMIKYKINDIRLFFNSDIRFLEQF
ncbi:MAG: phenylalanine--tRNA ligase subunit alpha [Candidatus Paceibacterota bacterium]|jgi:phenylalanyl-tRNA synthetase alpha chain